MMLKGLTIQTCLLVVLAHGFGSHAFAQPMSGELTAACMQAMDESEAVCACIEQEALATLSDDEQTFLLAIMTEDESLIDELRGSFTDANAQVVQNQMIASAIQCSG